MKNTNPGTENGLVRIISSPLPALPEQLQDGDPNRFLPKIARGLTLSADESFLDSNTKTEKDFEFYLLQYLKGLYLGDTKVSLQGMKEMLEADPSCVNQSHVELIAKKIEVIDSLAGCPEAYIRYDGDAAFGIDNLMAGHMVALGLVALYANQKTADSAFANFMSIRVKATGEYDIDKYFHRKRKNFPSTAAVKQLIDQITDHILNSSKGGELVEGLSRYMVSHGDCITRFEMSYIFQSVAKRPTGGTLMQQVYGNDGKVLNFAPIIDRELKSDEGKHLYVGDFGQWMIHLPGGYQLLEHGINALDARAKATKKEDRKRRFYSSLRDVVGSLPSRPIDDAKFPLRKQFLENLHPETAQSICNSLTEEEYYGGALPLATFRMIGEISQYGSRECAEKVTECVLTLSDRINFSEYVFWLSGVFRPQYDDLSEKAVSGVLDNNLKKWSGHKFTSLLGRVVDGTSEYATGVALDIGLGILDKELLDRSRRHLDWAFTLGNTIKKGGAESAARAFDILIGAYRRADEDDKKNFSYYIRGALDIESSNEEAVKDIGKKAKRIVREKSEHSALIRQVESGQMTYDHFLIQASQNTAILKRDPSTFYGAGI